MTQRDFKQRPSRNLGFSDVTQRSARHDFATVNSRARAEIDDVIGAAHRFFVVLDDDQ